MHRAATSASCLRWLTFLGTDAQSAGEEVEWLPDSLSSLSSPSRWELNRGEVVRLESQQNALVVDMRGYTVSGDRLPEASTGGQQGTSPWSTRKVVRPASRNESDS